MWALVSLICFILSGSNMIGYYKCSNEQQKKFNDFVGGKAAEGMAFILKGGFDKLTNSEKK